MINIVISAGDYFAKAEDVGEGNGIDVDNLSPCLCPDRH